MNKLFCIICLLFMTESVLGQQTAITSSGKKVKLNDNGSWEYIEINVGQSHGFRNIPWGSSREDVKNNEKGEIEYEDNDAVFYKGSIANIRCTIIFIFVDNLLVRGRYYFEAGHIDNNAYIDDYKKIKNLLLEKYGKADEDEQVWEDDTFKDSFTSWGMAISLGQMNYYTIWYTEQTLISMQLYGNNYKIKHDNMIHKFLRIKIRSNSKFGFSFFYHT